MPIKLEARQRLTAAKASAKAAIAFLTEIGFKGLSLKATQEDLIKFWYKGYDHKVLTKHLGKPTSVDKSIRYTFGKAGVVAIWPNNMTVVMKNVGGSGLVAPAKPALVPDAKHMPLVPDEPATTPEIHQSPNSPGSTENDNSKVPVTHISPAMEARYASIQGIKSPLAQMMFLKALWAYLNTAKFGGQLKAPNFKLLKNMGATSMRLRGRWWASGRLLEIAPRLFNASQNFCVEVVLHEMCHQAVSEIDKVNESSIEKGHGPTWVKWMRHVGLNPLRFDPTDNATFMTPKELKEHEAKKAEIKTQIKQNDATKEEHGLQRMMPFDNTPASIVRNGQLLNGLLVCKGPNQKGREVWVFLEENYIKTHKAGTNIQWTNTYGDHVYRYAGSDKDALRSEAAGKLATTIRAYFAKQKLARQVKRTIGRF